MVVPCVTTTVAAEPLICNIPVLPGWHERVPGVAVDRRADIEIALIGAQRPEVVERLTQRFTLHHVYADLNPLAALTKLGPRIRGAAGHGMAGLTRAHMELMPKLEICALNGVGLETSDELVQVMPCGQRQIKLGRTDQAVHAT